MSGVKNSENPEINSDYSKLLEPVGILKGNTQSRQYTANRKK